MRVSARLDGYVNAVAALHEAQSERDVFVAVHAACETVVGPLSLSGYVVARNGEEVRHVAQIGDCVASADTSWLTDGTAYPASEALDGSPILAVPLFDNKRVIGGVVISGPSLATPRGRRRCGYLVNSSAAALVSYHQRRLSQMVLEALEKSEEAISFYDEENGVVFTNEAYHRIFPHYPEPSALLGRSHLDLYRMDLDAGIIDDSLARNDPETYLARRRQMSKHLITRQREIQKISSRTYIYTRSRSKTGATMSRRIDITEQALTVARLREREQELHTLAFRDPLTGLFNRAHLNQLIGDLQERMHDGSLEQIAVFLVDLNSFKLINDTYGHEAGDFVLRMVAQRIGDIVSDEETVVRLGGDEFVVVFQRDLAPSSLATIGDAMLAAVARPAHYRDVVLSTGASVGIARRIGRDADLGTLVADADLAMYEAKKLKCAAPLLFHPSMRASMLERLSLLEDARKALRQNEFELHYQPQFRTKDLRLVGFEALVRWRNPGRGLLPPGLFIPLMEEHGLIDALGEWVLRTACSEAAAWPEDLHVAVNVSPLQVRNTVFPLILGDALLRSGLAPHRLELEITESVFIEDEASTRAQLELWKSLGVRIALDDFGSGYSSLSYLGQYQLDKIKVDRGFIGRINPGSPTTEAGIILQTIIDLGRALEKTITVEGVERLDQLAFLNEHGCSEVQGFLLGKPMVAAQARLLYEEREPCRIAG